MANPVTWFEVNSPDAEETAKFFSELFGWGTTSIPESNYVLADTRAGGGVNGGFGVSHDERTYSVFYVESDDIPGLLERADSAGGKTVVPYTETDIVTFAQFTDPAGNVVGLVAPSDQDSPVSEGDGVPVDWFEVLGPDPRALWSFYRELFGWDVHEGGTDEFLYGEVHPAEGERGSGGGIGSSPDGQPRVTLYAHVDDLKKYLDRSESLGGTTVMPPTDAPGISFAMLAGPHGSTFGIYVSKED